MLSPLSPGGPGYVPVASLPGALEFTHTIDGVVWVSLLGDCTFHADAIVVTPANPTTDPWPIIHGTFVITTVDGDTLTLSAAGHARLNPVNPTIFSDLYYDLKITGGTGKLAGAHGSGVLDHGFGALAESPPNPIGPGTEDFPWYDAVPSNPLYPPSMDLIDPNSPVYCLTCVNLLSAPPPGAPNNATGKACWEMKGNLALPGGGNDLDH